MARYQVAFTTPAAATNAAFVDLRTAAGARARLLEVGIFNAAATACVFSLERTTTVGTTSTTVVPVPGDPADAAALSVVGTAWSGAPANTGVPLRQVATAANIGAGAIWTFAFGDMVIPVSSSLCIFNRLGTTAGICRGYFLFAE